MANAFFRAAAIPALAVLLLTAIFVILSYTVTSPAQTPPTPSPSPTPEVVDGLSYTFHDATCPQLESIIRMQLQAEFAADIGQAAGLLRLHFHDCFVLGCDSSVLLDGSASGPSEEQNAPPNLSLRRRAFTIIENLRRMIHDVCDQTVSCSDITAIAARDAVFLSGGPNYNVPLGRRDGTTIATRNATLANLPRFDATVVNLTTALATKGFDTTDVVALSGAHTIGIASCRSFQGRLFPTQDPTLNPTFASNLLNTCPVLDTTNNTIMDNSPTAFDNRYYLDLMNRQGLFTSDQDLYENTTTRPIVTSFALDQTLFFDSFVTAMVKMSQLEVLTGTQGEIRANCSVINSNNLSILPRMKSIDNRKIASS